jgi:hypothetical protein
VSYERTDLVEGRIAVSHDGRAISWRRFNYDRATEAPRSTPGSRLPAGEHRNVLWSRREAAAEQPSGAR